MFCVRTRASDNQMGLRVYYSYPVFSFSVRTGVVAHRVVTQGMCDSSAFDLNTMYVGSDEWAAENTREAVECRGGHCQEVKEPTRRVDRFPRQIDSQSAATGNDQVKGPTPLGL